MNILSLVLSHIEACDRMTLVKNEMMAMATAAAVAMNACSFIIVDV